MKHFVFSVIFFLLLLSAFSSCKNANKTNGNSDNDDLSQQIEIPDDFEKIEYSIPEELLYGRIGKEFLYDKFYPIGWSKDGKFAYIVESADEGSGNYWFEIVLFDIVNNKVSWSWKPEESEQGSLQSVWKENYELFKKQLSEAEIIQQKGFELKPTKNTYKGNEYELTLETKNVNDPDFGFDVITELKIQIISEQLGQKTIINQKEGDYSRVTGAIIPGFIMCPFDDRILVICKKDRVGYEGPPNVVYFELYGSDLVRGFKMEKES